MSSFDRCTHLELTIEALLYRSRRRDAFQSAGGMSWKHLIYEILVKIRSPIN